MQTTDSNAHLTILCGDALEKELRAEINTLEKLGATGTDDAALTIACALAAVAKCVERAKESASIQQIGGNEK